MDRLYSGFVRRGDLVFDIGSHVGNRIGSFRRLGCRVVAVEPQPRLVRILRCFYGRDPDVAIEPMAIAAAPGNIELFVNLDNASLTTASSGFVAAASAAAGWRGERWSGRLVGKLGRVQASQTVVPAAVWIENRGRLARVLASRSVVDWGFHRLAGSAMR